MLATIIDWAALGDVVLYSLVASLLLTGLFTTGVLAIEVKGRQAPLAHRLVGIACFALCLGIVAFGIHVMFDSK